PLIARAGVGVSAKAIFLVIGIGVVIGLAMPGRKTAPSHALPNGDDAAAYARATDKALDTVLVRRPSGHFYPDVLVKDRVVHFLVDTAACTGAMTAEDARRVGFEFSESEFKVVGRGASGDVL